MQITHSFLGTTIGDARFLFFLLYEDYIQAQHALPPALKGELERFSREIENFGILVQPFEGDIEQTNSEVLEKNWSDYEEEILSNTPALLMIDISFEKFDPRENRWAHFHFESEPNVGQIRSLLQKLTQAAKDKKLDPFKIIEMAKKEKNFSELSDAIEIRPNVLGISIDLKKVWGPFKSFLRSMKS